MASPEALRDTGDSSMLARASQIAAPRADVPQVRHAGASLPTIAVISSLFPNRNQPTAGLFIRERMFRVAREVDLVVISPQPWFPLQGLIRKFKPTFRPGAPAAEVQDGITVLFPRFLAVPGLFRSLDGWSMALALRRMVARLRRERGVGLLDAHFAYPSGYAAVRVGRWLKLPVTITLRGTETRHLQDAALHPLAVAAVRGASRVFSVSDSLRRLFMAEGVAGDHIHVVGNGVDLDKFKRIDRSEARRSLGLPEDAKVLVSVGGLVDRKGFHRVIAVLPKLIARYPDLRYIIVGGPSAEGDNGPALRAQVRSLGLEGHVRFTGPLKAEEVHVPLSSADIFVLATANEGWANVFLEAMACGLPVVTTAVGGNAEVVSSPELGTIVPFGDANALHAALVDALDRDWDRDRIVAYARANTWDARIAALMTHYRQIARDSRS
jgi:teichuronic acid biosynthesis glycosyltransferase TuaC